MATEQITEIQNSGTAQLPTSSRFGRVDTSFLSNTDAEGMHAEKESTGSHRLQLAENRSRSMIATTVRSARHEVTSPYHRVSTLHKFLAY